VKALNGDKATCPNDYFVAYLQALLAVLKDDVMNFFMSFMLRESLKGASTPLLLPLFLKRMSGEY